MLLQSPLKLQLLFGWAWQCSNRMTDGICGIAMGRRNWLMHCYHLQIDWCIFGGTIIRTHRIISHVGCFYTGFSQDPHGYFTGPGFVDMSPLKIKDKNVNLEKFWEFWMVMYSEYPDVCLRVWREIWDLRTEWYKILSKSLLKSSCHSPVKSIKSLLKVPLRILGLSGSKEVKMAKIYRAPKIPCTAIPEVGDPYIIIFFSYRYYKATNGEMTCL